ncbi:MAG: hypothetical protein MUF86_05330 [Akkermansiaceae bacterium]|nr:hypothetical protein [Akkermansiaceae bacterium]MCU0777074.1 hypothetical protein [Akkermansiaceae bacterium]
MKTRLALIAITVPAASRAPRNVEPDKADCYRTFHAGRPHGRQDLVRHQGNPSPRLTPCF